jgi:hypothetical protein
MVGPNMAMIMMAGNTTTAGDGTFTIRNIPPGQYHLRTQGTRDGAQGQTVAEAVNMPLDLAGVDVTDVTLATSAGWAINGFVTSDTNGPPDVARDRIRIGSRPADADATPGPPPPPPGAPPPPGSPNADNGRVRDDWTFTVVGLLGAQYLRPTVPDGWAVKAILHDGRDITDLPSDGKSGNDLSGVQVVLTNKVTSLSGVLADNKGAPLTDGTVIVYADDASKWAEESRWIRAVRPDQQGQYQMKGLPPGEYLAVAVDYVEDGLWNDPEYLESLRRVAKRVTLADAQAQVLELKITTP